MAALKGLESGFEKNQRDAKLQKKFANCEVNASAAPNTISGFGDPDEWETVAAPQNRGDDQKNRGDQEDDDEVEIVDMNMNEKGGESSFLGRQLSELAIASIAENQTRVRSPVAAIALILHGSMRSNLLAFDCTGVPDDSKAKCNGFAAPIRSLPKTTFLPKYWDKEAMSSDSPKQSVTLRYRKAGIGSVLLKVDLMSSNTSETPTTEVSVNLAPIRSAQEPSQPLVFPLDSHVNMNSFAAAIRASNFGIQPALHYKGLPALLTLFAKAFDLGSVSDDQTDPAGEPNYCVPATQPVCDNYNSTTRNGFAAPVPNGPARVFDERNPSIGTAFPPQRPAYVGDFSGDLTNDPLRVLGSGGPGHLMPGNLMGPNHPMFRMPAGGIGGIGEASGFGMRPRFDLFGPPGGPQEVFPPDGTDGRPHPGQRRPPGGNPNADHLRPPNSLGNNGMFS